MNVHWEDRRGERVRESRERKEKRQPNQTDPTLSLLRQLWSQLIFLLLLHPFGTRSFLIFFDTLMILNYCVMTQRNRLDMVKMFGGRCFNGRERSARCLVFIRNLTFLHKSSARSRISDAPYAKISPVQISTEKKISSLHSKILQLSVLFSPVSMKNINFLAAEKYQRAVQNTHVITTIHHT